jgi:hypothetical protein
MQVFRTRIPWRGCLDFHVEERGIIGIPCNESGADLIVLTAIEDRLSFVGRQNDLMS